MKYIKSINELNEGRPILQDTPNELAYLDFKKWAYKNRSKIKKELTGIKDGSKFFIKLRNVWVDWANKNSKEFSKTFGDPVSMKDFGRALASMLKGDDIIIKREGNKLLELK
jgi:hypothetical protein|tara:strand:- start:285 stop:620 length:336 start_codon:yes stop_codon:yes gene_type:complete